MPRYEHTDLSFDVPRDWDDRSVAAFAAPVRLGGGMAANMVVTRDTLAPGEDIRAYADKQLVELAKRLDSFDLKHRQEIELSGLPAMELRFGWRGQSGLIEQRLVLVANRKRTVLSLTGTMSKADAGRLGPIFDRIFASVHLPEEPLAR